MDTQEFGVGRSGTAQARLEAMVVECLPSVRRWAHGRLPSAARGSVDTCDLVQEVVRRTLSKRGGFDVRHPFAVEGYMRRALLNLVCDHVRRIRRHPSEPEMPSENQLPPARSKSPLESVLDSEVEAQYRAALDRVRPKDRDLIVARIEQMKSAAEIKREFGFPSIAAAYIAVSRALARVAQVARDARQAGRQQLDNSRVEANP